MKDIITIIKSIPGKDASHCVDFTSVYFSAPIGLDADRLELSLRDLPGCSDLSGFYYNSGEGIGTFILLDTDVEPGIYPIDKPCRHVLEIDSSFLFNGLFFGSVMTHIATGIYESLCGAQINARVLNKLTNVAVTCPRCRELWQRCKIFEGDDFKRLE